MVDYDGGLFSRLQVAGGLVGIDMQIPSKPPSIGGLLDVVYDAYIGNMLTVLGEYLRFVVVRVYCGVHTQA